MQCKYFVQWTTMLGQFGNTQKYVVQFLLYCLASLETQKYVVQNNVAPVWKLTSIRVLMVVVTVVEKRVLLSTRNLFPCGLPTLKEVCKSLIVVSFHTGPTSNATTTSSSSSSSTTTTTTTTTTTRVLANPLYKCLFHPVCRSDDFRPACSLSERMQWFDTCRIHCRVAP